MKRIVIAALLSVFVAAPAFAADGKNSVGINYGTDLNGVFGIQGQFDISSMVDKQPISVQVFYKRASESISAFGLTATTVTTGMGAAGIYDLSSVFKLGNKKIQPYAGAGLILEKTTVNGSNTFPSSSASKNDLYYTLGARYFFTPQFDADLNYSQFGGLTFGANYNF